MTEGRETRGAAEITAWLQGHLAQLLGCPAEAVDPRARFETLGLDSATAVRVTMDLEDWLGRDVDPAMLYDFRTIDELSAALVGRAQGAIAPAGPEGTSEGSQ